MNKTPLYENHLAHGARMTDFSGFQMPVQFTRIQDEHMAVRQNAGIFDVSHMGEFLVEGAGALALLEKITTNTVSALAIGQAQYTLMTNPEGGIIDDLIIYRLGEQSYLLVVNAGNIRKDWDWIIENKSLDTYTSNESENTGLIALQGPGAGEILQKLTPVPLDEIAYYHFKKGPVSGIQDVIISATGYTGSGGFELYTEASQIEKLWNDICEAGADSGLLRAGLGARDTLRLEMGFGLYGQDIDDSTSPLEAGLGWVTKLDKDFFIGQDALVKQKSKGVVNRLKCFVLDDKRVARTGYTIHATDHKKIGEVRSGTFSPCLQRPIGMGYIDTRLLKKASRILISNGKKFFEGEIVKPPFVNVKDYVS
ncbi:MAG TPA: glycine cleavage system aminomethyltransferase GcvT [Membranihabitans sp.]|nr:glycine cleavage system aminomethyltransferase GcvT [Membranihabitans sp.]